MHLVLHVISGSAAGRAIHIREGQLARIGRTEWADFCFPAERGMADVHFAVKCDVRGCTVRSLTPAAPTAVNGEPVTEALVRTGDRITAGATTFQVAIEGLGYQPEEPAQATAGSPTAAAQESTDVVAICAYLQLGEDVLKLAHPGQPPQELLKELVQAKQFPAALRVQAHLLTARQAVWWGCLCVREVFGPRLPELEAGAFAAAARWVAEPGEVYRRGAEAAAEVAGHEGPGSLLADAVFFSGGSLAPLGSEPVAPDPRLCGTMVAGALTMAAYDGDAAAAPARFQAFLATAQKVADGQIPFPKMAA